MSAMTLDTEQWRQKLAGLIDPRDAVPAELKQLGQDNAIRFVATLPMLFGRELDRTTLWDRIASAIETAYAKTAGADTDFFISEVMRHIKAPRGMVAASNRLLQVMDLLHDASTVERQAWLDYLVTHVDTILVHSRRTWTRYKTERAAGQDTSWWGEQIDFDALEGGAE